MAISKIERFRQLSVNIAAYRKLRGLTQEQLAERVDVTRAHIGRVESTNDPSGLSLDLLFEIADALDVEPARLFEVRE